MLKVLNYHWIESGSESEGGRGETTHGRHWVVDRSVVVVRRRGLVVVNAESACHLGRCCRNWVMVIETGVMVRMSRVMVSVVHLTIARVHGVVSRHGRWSGAGSRCGSSGRYETRETGSSGSGSGRFIEGTAWSTHWRHDILKTGQSVASWSRVRWRDGALLLLGFGRQFAVTGLNAFLLHCQRSVHLFILKNKEKGKK